MDSPQVIPPSSPIPEVPEGAKTTAVYLQMSMALALEIVSGMTKPSEVFARHGFSEDDAKRMLRNPMFQHMLREAKSTWSADAATPKRIQVKAQLALEEMLEPHFRLGIDPNTPAAARNEIVKTFERLSGMGQGKDGFGAGVSDKFSIIINLGTPEEQRTLRIDAPVLEHANDET